MKKRIKQLIKENKTNFQIINIILREFKKKRAQPIIDLITDIRGNITRKELPICYVCGKKILSYKKVLAIGGGLYRHKTRICEDKVIASALSNIKK